MSEKYRSHLLKLQFWFEYGSTYSYPAAMRIERLARKTGVDVEWRPFLLGPLFKSQQGMNDSPFNVIPVKGRYMWRDLARICDKHDLKLNRPPVFPQNGLLASRVTLALNQTQRPAFAKAVYLANFAEGHDISSEDTVKECLRSSGVDPEEPLRLASTSDIKARLRAETEKAVEFGLFGAPSFICPDGEMFWGNDRLEDALAWTVHGTLRPPERN